MGRNFIRRSSLGMIAMHAAVNRPLIGERASIRLQHNGFAVGATVTLPSDVPDEQRATVAADALYFAYLFTAGTYSLTEYADKIAAFEGSARALAIVGILRALE